MSVGSIGPGGLDDDQAQKVWDSGQPVYTDTATHSAAVTGPAISCINWHSVMLSVLPTNGPLLMVVHWYSDETLGTEMGKRLFTLDATNAATLTAVLPNLGPWMRIITTPAGGIGNYQINLAVVMSDRIHPVVVPPVTPLLLNAEGSLAGSATKTVTSLAYYGGPVQVSAAGGTLGTTVTLSYMYTNFLYKVIASYSVAPRVVDSRTMIVPPLALKLDETNQDNVSTNPDPYCHVVASSTGAG